MILTRTPYRVSLFGGGSDYPAAIRECGGGAVLSVTINRYCWLSVRPLPPFFDHHMRVAWSKVELVDRTEQVQHPGVRAVLEYEGLEEPRLEIHHDGDLPARSGMGASSAFTVGLLLALWASRNDWGAVIPTALAAAAIEVERAQHGANVGMQDQIACATGGFNHIRFDSDGSWRVERAGVSADNLRALEDRLVLAFTGLQRDAVDVAKEFVGEIVEKRDAIQALRSQVEFGRAALAAGNFENFGRLLHEAWQTKRSIAKSVSTDRVDHVYEAARRAGATGGKLLGAGGGGFMVLCVEPERRAAVMDALRDLVVVPFKFESEGAQVVYRSVETES